MAKDLDTQSKITLEPNTPILVAAAWPYVNGKIHVGHLVGYFLPADIFARYNRLKGRPVLMVSGSDCYGTPITVAADKEGKTPQEIVDEYHPQVLQLIETLNVQYELFTKTTSEIHHEVVKDLFVKLANKGFISKKITQQYYSEEDKKFLPDRYIEGKCPNCGFEEARADECDNCGIKISEGQLINPHSKLSKSAVTLKNTEHYFLELDKLQEELKDYISDKDFWRDWVYQETKGWLSKGLEGRSITRDLDWGIEIPTEGIPEELKLDNAENKRFYVWFDAVVGYYSASVEWSRLNSPSFTQRRVGEDLDSDQIQGEITPSPSLDKEGDKTEHPKWLDWKYYWQNPDARHYYFMGKDNLFFHTLWWPGILLGSKDNLQLPYNVSVSQWLNLNSQKFSKSRGVVLYPDYVVENYGLDILRYYLVSIFPENKDSNWDWKGFVTTNNSELVANLGNFIHRTLSFYKNNPELEFSKHEAFAVEDFVREEIVETYNELGRLIEECKFSEALQRVMKLSAFGNKYLNDNEPWKVIKQDLPGNGAAYAASATIYNCLTIINNLKILLHPILPTATDKLNRMLGFTDKISTEVGSDKWVYKDWNVDQKLEEFLEPLFKKFDEKEVLEKEERLDQTTKV